MQDRIYSRISRELVLISLFFFLFFSTLEPSSTVLSRLLSCIYIPPTCALELWTTELGHHLDKSVARLNRDFTLVYVRLR